MTQFYIHFASDGRKRVYPTRVSVPKQGTFYRLTKQDWKRLCNSKYKLILEDGGFTVVTTIPRQGTNLPMLFLLGIASFSVGFIIALSSF